MYIVHCRHNETAHIVALFFLPQWTVDGKEKKRSEKERKKGKGGRVQVGKRMPAGRKAVAHHSTSESSNEEEGEEEDTQVSSLIIMCTVHAYTVRNIERCVCVHIYMYCTCIYMHVRLSMRQTVYIENET